MESAAVHDHGDSPPLPGDDFANAWAINDRNQVVGASFGQGIAVPFLYEPGSGTHRLNATEGAAVAINERGDIAETAWVCPGSPHALSASVDGTYRDLGTFGDPSGSCNTSLRSEAFAISSTGVIVGCAQKSDGSNHAFSFSGGQLTEIPSLGGPLDPSCAFAINTQGQIAGQFTGQGPSGYFPNHAFLFQEGQMVDLGAEFGSRSSLATAINERGQVAGEVTFQGGDPDLPGGGAINHAFLYDEGVMSDLGTFQGLSTHVRAMNDSGQIVGGAGGRAAFLWQDGAFHDLASLVDDPTVRFIEGRAINNRGAIVASGMRNGRSALLLLMPNASVPLVPVATLDSSQAVGYAPLWEGFDGTRSYSTDPNAWIAACRWSFGDGTPDSPTCWALHVYPEPGTYVATLTVTGNLGRSASSSITITALPNPGPVPVTQFLTSGSGPRAAGRVPGWDALVRGAPEQLGGRVPVGLRGWERARESVLGAPCVRAAGELHGSVHRDG